MVVSAECLSLAVDDVFISKIKAAHTAWHLQLLHISKIGNGRLHHLLNVQDALRHLFPDGFQQFYQLIIVGQSFGIDFGKREAVLSIVIDRDGIVGITQSPLIGSCLVCLALCFLLVVEDAFFRILCHLQEFLSIGVFSVFRTESHPDGSVMWNFEVVVDKGLVAIARPEGKIAEPMRGRRTGNDQSRCSGSRYAQLGCQSRCYCKAGDGPEAVAVGVEAELTACHATGPFLYIAVVVDTADSQTVPELFGNLQFFKIKLHIEGARDALRRFQSSIEAEGEEGHLMLQLLFHFLSDHFVFVFSGEAKLHFGGLLEGILTC